MHFSRRHAVKLGLSAAALAPWSRIFAEEPAPSGSLITKPIPSTGERLPVVGIGTGATYGGEHVPGALAGAPHPGTALTPERRAELKELFRAYPALGGKVIDTAFVYVSEPLVGELTSELGNRSQLFIATKVAVGLGNIPPGRDSGRAQIEQSFQRHAAERVLPAAQDLGMAVMINVPFGKKRLWNKTRGKALPEWAAEFDCRSWGQFFLKYVVSHPAVTCAIPGVSNLKHLQDDMGAARGRLPDADMRRRMESYIDSI